MQKPRSWLKKKALACHALGPESAWSTKNTISIVRCFNGHQLGILRSDTAIIRISLWKFSKHCLIRPSFPWPCHSQHPRQLTLTNTSRKPRLQARFQMTLHSAWSMSISGSYSHCFSFTIELYVIAKADAFVTPNGESMKRIVNRARDTKLRAPGLRHQVWSYGQFRGRTTQKSTSGQLLEVETSPCNVRARKAEL